MSETAMRSSPWAVPANSLIGFIVRDESGTPIGALFDLVLDEVPGRFIFVMIVAAEAREGGMDLLVISWEVRTGEPSPSERRLPAQGADARLWPDLAHPTLQSDGRLLYCNPEYWDARKCRDELDTGGGWLNRRRHRSRRQSRRPRRRR